MNPKNITLRTNEDGVWIAASRILPTCHACGATEVEAIANFQGDAKAHLEALQAEQSQFSVAFLGISHQQM